LRTHACCNFAGKAKTAIFLQEVWGRDEGGTVLKKRGFLSKDKKPAEKKVKKEWHLCVQLLREEVEHQLHRFFL